MKHELRVDPDKETQGEEAKKRLARSLGLSEDATQEDLLKAVGGEEKVLLDAIGEEEARLHMPSDKTIGERMVGVFEEPQKEGSKDPGDLENVLHAAGISFEKEKFDVYFRDANGEILAKFIDLLGRKFTRTKRECEGRLFDLRRLIDSNIEQDAKGGYTKEYEAMEKVLKGWPYSHVLHDLP